MRHEQARLQFDASAPFRVAQSVRDLTAARSQDVNARAAIAKAVVSYEAAAGTLLSVNGIDLDTAEAGNLFDAHR